MSIDIKDYRKKRLADQEEAAKTAPVKQPPLEQVYVAENFLTGDDKLDKMIRGLEALIVQAKNICDQAAEQGMSQCSDEVLKKFQLIYAFNRGRIEAWVEASKIPQRIVVEAKQVS